MSETTTQCPPNDSDSPCDPPVVRDEPKMPKEKDCPQPCCCPPKPGGDRPASCLDTMIKEQSKLATQAAAATSSREDLIKRRDKIITALQTYTQPKYESLLKQWKKQDGEIVCIIRNLLCSIKCWKCVLECHLCPLLYDIRKLETEVGGTGVYAPQVDTLAEQAAWHLRNQTERSAYFERIVATLTAWEDPAKTLLEVLNANQKSIDAIGGLLSTDQPAALYTFFVKLLPAHWAIRPRTKGASDIPADILEVCLCGEATPDDCCGPDTGLRSVRDRLSLEKPVPYLVEPDELPKIVCCLVQGRYIPAKQKLAEAAAWYETAKKMLDDADSLLKAKATGLEAAFKAALTPQIECRPYRTKKGLDDPCTPEPDPCSDSPMQQTGA